MNIKKIKLIFSISLLILNFYCAPTNARSVRRKNKNEFTNLEQISSNLPGLELKARSKDLKLQSSSDNIDLVLKNANLLFDHAPSHFIATLLDDTKNINENWLMNTSININPDNKDVEFELDYGNFKSQDYLIKISNSQAQEMAIFKISLSVENIEIPAQTRTLMNSLTIDPILLTEPEMDDIFSKLSIIFRDTGIYNMRRRSNQTYELTIPTSEKIPEDVNITLDRRQRQIKNNSIKFAQVAPVGPPGAPGPNGPNGADGADGADGANGDFNPGADIATANRSIGSTDNESVNIETNNQSRISVLNNGNVGFGVTNPSNFLLELGGSFGPNTNDSIDIGSSTLRWQDVFLNSSGLKLGSNGNEATIGFSTVTPSITFDPDSDSDLEMTILQNGNIGISDATPDALLEISSSAGVSDTFMLSSDDANDGDLLIVKNNGNVGIGTTTPGAKLELNGQIKIRGGSPGLNKVLTATDGLGNATWQNIAGGAGDFADGGDTAGGDRTIGNNDNFDLSIITNNSSAIHIENSGNVGIGIDPPIATLDVNGQLLLSSGNQAAGKVLVSSDVNGNADWAAAPGVGAAVDFTNGGDNAGAGRIIGNTSTSDDLFIETNNTQRITIDGGANRVGIGTTTPAVDLDINGDMRIDGDLSTARLRTSAGTLVANGFAFSDDLDTGFFNPAADQISLQAGGVDVYSIEDATLTNLAVDQADFNRVRTSFGSVGAPGFTFSNDTDTGWYRSAVDQYYFVSNGTQRVHMATTIGLGKDFDASIALDVNGDLELDLIELDSTGLRLADGNAAAPSATFVNDTDTGWHRNGADNWGIDLGGSEVYTLSAAGQTYTGDLFAPLITKTGTIDITDGSAAAPTATFANDTDTGIFRYAAESWGITTGGTSHINFVNGSTRINTAASNGERLTVNGQALITGTMTVNSQVRIPDANAAAPAITFNNDTDTGFFRTGADNWGISTGGTERINLNAFGVGIGATATETLHIAGELHATGISGDGATQLVCIKGDDTFGTCTDAPDGTGSCTCA